MALQIVKEEQISRLGTDVGICNCDILDQHICPNLAYKDYNSAIKQASEQYGLGKHKFTTHEALIGSATVEFEQIKDLGVVKLADGWKCQQSAENYIRNGRAAIAALDIAGEVQTEIMAAAYGFAWLMTRYADKTRNRPTNLVPCKCSQLPSSQRYKTRCLTPNFK